MVPMCQGRRVCGIGRGAHQTAETVDMARLAEPPALALLPQGYPLTISCPVSAYRSLCADTAWALVSHSFYIELEASVRSFSSNIYAWVSDVKTLRSW